MTLLVTACREEAYRNEEGRTELIVEAQVATDDLIFIWVPPNVAVGDDPRFTTTDGRELVPVLDPTGSMLAVAADPSEDHLVRFDSELLSCEGFDPTRPSPILFCEE